jgi:hypothetical protein
MSHYANEEYRPPCQCHACTWLRAPDVERASIPAPERGKCDHHHQIHDGSCPERCCRCHESLPDAAVEELIHDLDMLYGREDKVPLCIKLRELVALARKQ